MHPAGSLIFFTVASGVGFGLLGALGLAVLWGAAPSGGVFWGGFLLGFGLSVAGLLSSTFHLGHPERAWRALSQWRSSWLSREGVAAIVTLGLSGLYALSLLLAIPASGVLGPLSSAAALATVFCTAMIYAQLRTVQRWNTWLTPAVFLFFSTGSGALLMSCLTAFTSEGAGGWPLAAAIFTFIGWSLKRRWWQHGDSAHSLSTPESATGLGAFGRVTPFEAPHTGENYLTREMGFRVARRHAEKLRLIALGLGGFLPLVLTLAASGGAAPVITLPLAAIALIGGLVVERWLFFAEARHAVMTYYRAE